MNKFSKQTFHLSWRLREILVFEITVSPKSPLVAICGFLAGDSNGVGLYVAEFTSKIHKLIYS